MNKIDKLVPLKEVDRLKMENLALRKERLSLQIQQIDVEMISLVDDMRRRYRVPKGTFVDVSQDFQSLMVFKDPNIFETVKKQTDSDGEEKEKEDDERTGT